MSSYVRVGQAVQHKWPEKGKLDGLQAGRAIAALMVVAFHANGYILPEKIYDGAIGHAIFGMGYAGVEFFFVLSGFIMWYVHAHQFGQADQAGVFLRRRALRIYPLYWVIFGLVLVVGVITQFGPRQSLTLGEVLASAFLIPTAEFPIMRIAWTMMHEMLFYLVFACLMVARVTGPLVFALWLLGSAVSPFLGLPAGPYSVIFSAYNLLFAVGIAAAWAYPRLTPVQAWAAFTIGVGIFFAVGLSEALGNVVWDHSLRTWAYGIGAGLFTAALAALALHLPRWLTFLGDASYSIYLVHIPVMGSLAYTLSFFGMPWGVPPLVMLAVMVWVSAAAGCLCYIFIERPMMRFFARYEKRAAEGQPVSVSRRVGETHAPR